MELSRGSIPLLDLNMFLLYKITTGNGHKFKNLDRPLAIQVYTTGQINGVENSIGEDKTSVAIFSLTSQCSSSKEYFLTDIQ